jgi:hypothetical protein
MGSLWANSSRLGVQKILQKSEKKACQVSESSINEESWPTNQPIFRSKIF